MAWFPFYVNDWLGSKRVKRMTNEQRGVYMSLLVWQWQGKGYLDGSMEENLVLADAYPPELEKWKPVIACFESDGNGRWFNRKLLDLWESELEKREKYCRGAELTNAKRHAERTAERDTKRPDSVTPPSPSPSPSPDPTPSPKLASLASEDGRAGDNPELLRRSEFRTLIHATLCRLFSRPMDARWTCEEEHLLVDLSRSVTEQDLTLFETWWTSQEGEDANRLPQSVKAALSGWMTHLDRARLWKSGKTTRKSSGFREPESRIK